MTKRIFCLGGAGKIAQEAVLDLFTFEPEWEFTIADVNGAEAKRVADRFQSPRVKWMQVDLHQTTETTQAMRGYDLVLDGTTITLNGLSTQCIAEAGCHGINLNGFGEEDIWHDKFTEQNRVCLPGFGMTPGVTQLMAMHAALSLDTVHTVRVSHGSYRPIAFSKSIAETTTYEYDPLLPSRVVFENGAFVQVPPFARPREIVLPEPYGRTTQYIIPHAETRTLRTALEGKNVQLIEVRGTWPEENMRLISALYAYDFLKNDTIVVNGKPIGIMDCIAQYLVQSEKGQRTDLYGYALHVEVEGERSGTRYRHTLTHTHPPSDGTVPEWAGLRAYTRNVGIPFAIAAAKILHGEVKQTGIVTPEEAFLDTQRFFDALRLRGIVVHEKVEII
ncbi:MAG: saccharopine dehydrogenase family protein [Bacilli bacterium]